jgi:hypothetical protein
MVKKNTKTLNPEKKDAKPTPFESMLYTNLSGELLGSAPSTPKEKNAFMACTACKGI